MINLDMQVEINKLNAYDLIGRLMHLQLADAEDSVKCIFCGYLFIMAF